MMNKPRTLKKGDRVALIAPASPASEEQLNAAQKSIIFLNLEPVFFPSCYKKHGYLSGLDEERAHDVCTAFSDPSISAIFCIRGGYGTPRLLSRLDYDIIKKNPKLFLGYSDITAFHIVFQQLCNLPCLHGPMPGGNYETADTLTFHYLKSHLFSKEPVGILPAFLSPNLITLFPGKTSGKMIGGNLSLLTATLGSPYEVDTKDKLLFIEDVNERPYEIDRGLTALALAGKFRDCSGIILGAFENCYSPDYPGDRSLRLTEIFEEIILPWKKPAIAGFQAGHLYPHITLPFGVEAILDATNRTINIIESITE